MAKNTSIALGDHFQTFVEKQVGQGRFGSASEVVRAGLRLLEEREAKFEALRRAIQEGIDSGPAEPFDFDEFIDEKESDLKGADQSHRLRTSAPERKPFLDSGRVKQLLGYWSGYSGSPALARAPK